MNKWISLVILLLVGCSQAPAPPDSERFHVGQCIQFIAGEEWKKTGRSQVIAVGKHAYLLKAIDDMNSHAKGCTHDKEFGREDWYRIVSCEGDPQ